MKSCIHLSWEKLDNDEQFFLYFTGTPDYSLICKICMEGEVVLKDADFPSYFHPDEYGLYFSGIRGEPGFRTTDKKVKMDKKIYKINLSGVPVTHCTSEDVYKSLLYLLRYEASEKQFILSVFDLEKGVISRQYAINYTGHLNLEEQIGMEVKEPYVVIYNRLNTNGFVYHIQDAKTIMDLERGDYHVQHCEFAAKIIDHKGRDLLIHTTDWNRLDITDLNSLECLSTRYGDLQDYFHSSISISPGRKYVLSNGWVWHPVGVMEIWELDRWLYNPWESDHGESKRTLNMTTYFWDREHSWIDAKTIVLYGFGSDDEIMIPAALVVDVENSKVLNWFFGPTGIFEFDMISKLLYCYGEGLSIWELDGTQIYENKELEIHAFCNGKSMQINNTTIVVYSPEF